MNCFITAIGTDSGKTVVSSIVCEALKADYWKPVQCGEPRDTQTVKEFISNKETIFHQEAYFLKKPASPHDAAKEENIILEIEKVKNAQPKTSNSLVIEGAGGLMVPINETEFVVDIPEKLDIPVILVANLYLGSINHTLLTINELKRRNIKVHGIIFNGEPNPESQRIIIKHSGYKELLHILPEEHMNKEIIRKYADMLALTDFVEYRK